MSLAYFQASTTSKTRNDAHEQQAVMARPKEEQEVCTRALTDVIRNHSLNARDKAKQLEVLCLKPEGSLLRRCLDGIGWSSKRNCREGYPVWSEAVYRLTLALVALANKEPVQFPEQVCASPHSALALQGTDPARARAPCPYLFTCSVAVAAAT